MVGRHADLQLAADFLDAGAACLLLAGRPQLLDDLFWGVSFSFHGESQTRLAPGTLIADGSIFRENASIH
jgi:hypothetical protein